VHGGHRQFLKENKLQLTTTNNNTDADGNPKTRSLGMLVARGTLLVLISPVDGSEEIANPFVQAEDDDDE
jgi:hypothetical protein